MSAIVTKIVEKYNLSSEMCVTDLSRYTSEFLENLTDDRKRNQARRRLREGFKFTSEQPQKSSGEEIIREKAKQILQNRYGFSKDQVDDLFALQSDLRRLSTQKNDQPKSRTMHKVPCSTINIAISNRVPQETIGKMAHRLLRDKLSIRDVRAEAYALALSAKNANAGSSRLFRFRRELKNLGASSQIIEATKFPDITEQANKIQENNRKRAEANRIDYPDEFTLESVKKRLDSYDTSTVPDVQALADVMVMLCIRPAELTTLRGGVVNGVGLKIDDTCDAEIYDPISKVDVLGIIREIEISIMSQGTKWKKVKVTDIFVSNEPQLTFVLVLGQPWIQENAMKVDFPNKTLTLLDGTDIQLVIGPKIPPPTQHNQSVDDYFKMIKVYATVLDIDLENQDLKGTFFNGLSRDNKKEVIRFGFKKPLNEIVDHLNRISSGYTDIQNFQFGNLSQEESSIMDFYMKVKKYCKLAGHNEDHLKHQFLRGLSPENQIEARRCGLELPLDELVEKLRMVQLYNKY
ncbi:8953_t:CDS:2 [Paraglomus occultum]|uniref:8953_t:CDS:1 n=1 Tax=Paraglomus occultum TaxID=144539 RepID=A0A9N9D743_9GLOM|nr:8953_t:CDS:2 [Paraglomus occultum]